MASEIVVQNTVAFLFPTGAAQPNLDEMAAFVKTLVAEKRDMESAYKISEERSVYVKFKTEAAMQKALLDNAAKHSFHYTNGKVVEVLMSVAGGNIRYVRIFDLPPEVNDQHISLVLEKYGKIKRLDREKFPIDLGLGNLSTGVRGVHMDIEREIPPILCFAGRKGRLYYEQMTPRCYFCLAEGHFKAACPNKKSKKRNKAKQNPTFADVAGSSGRSLSRGEREEEENSKEEEVTAAVTAAADNADANRSEEISVEEESEEEMEMDETTAAENSQKEAIAGLLNIFHTIKNKKEEQDRAAEEERRKAAEEEQRKQRKSKPRAKTGSVSPPMKKKN